MIVVCLIVSAVVAIAAYLCSYLRGIYGVMCEYRNMHDLSSDSSDYYAEVFMEAETDGERILYNNDRSYYQVFVGTFLLYCRLCHSREEARSCAKKAAKYADGMFPEHYNIGIRYVVSRHVEIPGRNIMYSKWLRIEKLMKREGVKNEDR